MSLIEFTRNRRWGRKSLPPRHVQRNAHLQAKRRRTQQVSGAVRWFYHSLLKACVQSFASLGLLLLRILWFPLKLLTLLSRVVAVILPVVAGIMFFIIHMKLTPIQWQNLRTWEAYALIGAILGAWLGIVWTVFEKRLMLLEKAWQQESVA